ncbi:hypothetical protein M440DRAFT_196574 [Trichoderma longibrachiatum ATCC 18648]|uniref:Uncharacterized protein n=1 Tax=Trichoderma longibrachiatum ATCC 18648 TaxID=983965 RepID=A0A2T4CG52_TRILO|nr:hypothetical protein M440DRAFT_196574 [Trichoderma longibrachiatum ATCC 18648]
MRQTAQKTEDKKKKRREKTSEFQAARTVQMSPPKHVSSSAYCLLRGSTLARSKRCRLPSRRARSEPIREGSRPLIGLVPGLGKKRRERAAKRKKGTSHPLYASFGARDALIGPHQQRRLLPPPLCKVPRAPNVAAGGTWPCARTVLSRSGSASFRHSARSRACPGACRR